ncbi:DUF4168 domain-containing protein [Phormidesmis sp. 146-33]
MMNCVSRFPFQLNRVLARSLTIATLSTLGLLTGVAPNLSGQPTQLFDIAVHAQEESTFTRYVKAAFEIEKMRRSLLDQVKQLTGGNVPSNVCQSSSLAQVSSNVRDQVKGICDNFSAQAKSIVQDKYKLSRDEFNSFQRQSQNPEMKSRIEAEIRNLNLR